MLASGGGCEALTGVSAATCRTTESTKLLAVPVELWQSWFLNSDDLAKWLRFILAEDLYSALRPLRSPRHRTFLDAIDKMQSSLRTLHLKDLSDLDELEEADTDTSWLLPGVSYILPDLDPYGLEGLSRSTLRRCFDRSNYGLRLVGYPKAVLQELLEPSVSTPSTGDDESLNATDHNLSSGALEELPDWHNPDGEKLLASALSQEQARPSKDRDGVQVKPIFGHSGVEQGLALLQMICETLRLPFRRDVVDRMLKGMVGSKQAPTLENIGQIADGLGLNAVLMQLPSAHLGRLSLPTFLSFGASGFAFGDRRTLEQVGGTCEGRGGLIYPFLSKIILNAVL